MKTRWVHFKIGKYRFRFQLNDPTWIGIEYKMKDETICDITISRRGITKQYLPF